MLCRQIWASPDIAPPVHLMSIIPSHRGEHGSGEQGRAAMPGPSPSRSIHPVARYLAAIPCCPRCPPCCPRLQPMLPAIPSHVRSRFRPMVRFRPHVVLAHASPVPCQCQCSQAVAPCHPIPCLAVPARSRPWPSRPRCVPTRRFIAIGRRQRPAELAGRRNPAIRPHRQHGVHGVAVETRQKKNPPERPYRKGAAAGNKRGMDGNRDRIEIGME